MNLRGLIKKLSILVWGLFLLVPFQIAAEPVAQQTYYSIQLILGSSALIRNTWLQVKDQPFSRIESINGQEMLRIGFWNNKQQAAKRLALIKENISDAFIVQAKYEPDNIVQGWMTKATKQSIVGRTDGRTESLSLPSNLIRREEVSPPEIISFKDRHKIWMKRPLIKPAKKPFYPTRFITAEPVQKRKIMPEESPLWRLFNDKNYDALQAEIIRVRKIYPNWRPPQKLLNLLLQGQIAQKITLSIKENDPAMLNYMANLYPDVFNCAHIDWAWALADAQASLKKTSSLVRGLHRLIPDCSEQDRLATLYKARYWLTPNEWEMLVEREARAYRTSQGEANFQKLRYNHQTETLLTTYQTNDQMAFRTLFLQLADEIERSRDVDTALMGGWHYYNAQETVAAESWFNKVLTWDPKQQDALRGLSFSALQDKRFNDAQYYAYMLPSSSKDRQKILSATTTSDNFSLLPENTSIALTGAELNPGNSFAYAGVILPLSSRFGKGFVQRYWADRLTYSFDQNGRKIEAEQWGVEALLGYRKYNSQGWWAAYVGPVYRNIQFSPNDADISNRGDAFRGKIQIEGERILTDTWRVNGIASYVTGQNNYWVRGRLLHALNNSFSLGPEVIALGDNNFQILQFGWVILAAEVLPRVDVGVRFGVRKAREQEATGYLGIDFSHSF